MAINPAATSAIEERNKILAQMQQLETQAHGVHPGGLRNALKTDDSLMCEELSETMLPIDGDVVDGLGAASEAYAQRTMDAFNQSSFEGIDMGPLVKMEEQYAALLKRLQEVEDPTGKMGPSLDMSQAMQMSLVKTC